MPKDRRCWLALWAGFLVLLPVVLFSQEEEGGNFTAPEVGTVTPGDGAASKDKGAWPQFRGPNRDGIAADAKKLYRTWPAEGPKVLWTITGLGMGYSGPAIFGGKVYFHDYDKAKSLWMARCVSLADGKEIWRWSYKRRIKVNHGITRTIPVVDEKYVISLDPEAVLHCFDAATGKRLWAKDLVRDFGAAVPMWYNGQCPLDAGDRIILGVGGKDMLMAAFDKATGKVLWKTPNPDGLALTQSSVVPMTLCGKKQYVWCTLKGVIAVDPADGKLLWQGPAGGDGQLAWKPNQAVGPSAVQVPGDRVFMTGGYKAGSVMFKVEKDGEKLVAKSLFTLKFEQFDSMAHTPIVWKDHLFAVGENDKLFTCLDLDGKVVWSSPEGTKYDLGSYLLADGMFFLLEGDTGKLHLVEASTDGWKELAAAPVLGGNDVWAPMALVNGKLVLRDMSKMVCIEAGPAEQ